MIELLAWWWLRRWIAQGRVPVNRIGRFGEWVAVRAYGRRGYRILGRNRIVGGVEIDLIVRMGGAGAIILVEVKSSMTSLTGLRRIDRERRDRLARAAMRLAHRGSVELHAAEVDLSGRRPRVRLVSITPESRSAWSLSGRGTLLRRS